MPDLAPLWDGLTDPQVLSALVGVLGTAVGVVIANRHTIAVADRERAYTLADKDCAAFEGRLYSMDGLKGQLLATHEERRHYARQGRDADWIKADFFFSNAETQRTSMRAIRASIPDHPLIEELERLSAEFVDLLEDSGRSHGRGIESEDDLDEIERRARAWEESAADLQRRALEYHEDVRARFLPRSWKDRFRMARFRG